MNFASYFLMKQGSLPENEKGSGNKTNPADTRKWIMRGLKSVPAGQSAERFHCFIDPW